MAESKFDVSKSFEALNRDADAPKESSEETRGRHSRERDSAFASLETIAGTYPHVHQGGEAAADLADAARNFAKLADRHDEEADAREADAKKAADTAEKAAKAADKAAEKADAEDSAEKAEK